MWSGTQNGLHCSFTLERTDRTQFVLNCTLQIYQQCLPAARQLLHVSANVKVSKQTRVAGNHDPLVLCNAMYIVGPVSYTHLTLPTIYSV